MGKNIYEKIWDSHIVEDPEETPPILYVDLHLTHEVTSPVAYDGIKQRGIKVRRPDRTFATIDHVISTEEPEKPLKDKTAQSMIEKLKEVTEYFGVKLFWRDSGKNGIVHVVGPELGLTQPGQVVVCGDSHTSTHGAMGTLAFGIGTSEVEQVLATQCLFQKKSNTMRIDISGQLSKGVTAKDVILHIINKIGAGGGTGYVIEYTGNTIQNMDMEERMTICNMTIEAGARSGIIAPDEKTFEYLKGREYAPSGENWDKAVKEWKQLQSDSDAKYDEEISINASDIAPRVTYGTALDMSVAIDETLPTEENFEEENDRNDFNEALEYMGFEPGQKIEGTKIQHVFIGSCTNGRIKDFRDAAEVIKGKKVASGIRALAVPGSQQVKDLAEEEGLDKIFKDAGFEWREPGCSICLDMNPDFVPAGEYCVATSNRNFKGRQGKGSRAILASPITAAVCAIEGKITDVRKHI